VLLEPRTAPMSAAAAHAAADGRLHRRPGQPVSVYAPARNRLSTGVSRRAAQAGRGHERGVGLLDDGRVQEALRRRGALMRRERSASWLFVSGMSFRHQTTGALRGGVVRAEGPAGRRR
jgi:hypothetical protein